MTASHVEKISFHVYHALGMTFDETAISKSILATAMTMASDTSTQFTQNYFYEEAIFYSVLAVDAENRYGLLSWLIRQYENERLGGKSSGVSSQQLGRQVLDDHVEVALGRMSLCGIEPRLMDARGMNAWWRIRMGTYLPLLDRMKAIGVEGLAPDLSFPFSPPDNPLRMFLSEAHGLIGKSLGDGDLSYEPNPATNAALGVVITQRWKATAIDASQAVTS